MSIPRRPYAASSRYPVRGPTFLPRPPPPAGVGAGLGAGAGAGGLSRLIGGLAAPLLCLGCLSSLALLGLFATMIGAATYMNAIQSQLRKNQLNAGPTIELNIIVLFCALLCSIYVFTKHRRDVSISN